MLVVRLTETFKNSIAEEVVGKENVDYGTIVSIKDYVPISDNSIYNSIDLEIKGPSQDSDEDTSTEEPIPEILGERLVYPYDRAVYTVKNITDGV